METMDMEVEEQQQLSLLPNSKSFKRLGIRNSIQTNFRDDFVFQIVPKDDWTSMAVSLSTNAMKLYSLVTGQYYEECKDHSSNINHISFSNQLTAANILHSCSSNGTIRAWDTRTSKQVSPPSLPPPV